MVKKKVLLILEAQKKCLKNYCYNIDFFFFNTEEKTNCKLRRYYS